MAIFWQSSFFKPKNTPLSQKDSQKKIFKKSSVVAEIQLFEYYRVGGNRIRLKTLIAYFSKFGRLPIGTFSREPAQSDVHVHETLQHV